MQEKEVAAQLSEDKLRKAYDLMKCLEVAELEDKNEVCITMFDAIEEAGFDTEEWDQILAREFNTFAEGEKYDYSTDLRRTFDDAVATPLSAKILKKMPNHIFWDIKKPLVSAEKEMFMNPYNPARKYPFQSFFDMRRHEDWIESKEQMRNLKTDISQHSRTI